MFFARGGRSRGISWDPIARFGTGDVISVRNDIDRDAGADFLVFRKNKRKVVTLSGSARSGHNVMVPGRGWQHIEPGGAYHFAIDVKGGGGGAVTIVDVW